MKGEYYEGEWNKRSRNKFRLFKKPPEIIKHFDMEAQTDLHPIPVKIDPSYKWNIWDYKREALRFVSFDLILYIFLTVEISCFFPG